MYFMFAHSLVFRNVLRAKSMVTPENNSHTKEQNGDCDECYDQQHFHFCAQNSMQRYAKKLKVES